MFALAGTLSAQKDITDQKFKEADSLLWSNYEKAIEPIMVRLQAYPEKQDSLYAQYKKILDHASRENIRLAMKYASTPSGLQRVFMVRNDISKDSLSQILAQLLPEMRTSAYGKNIRAYIDTQQIAEGDSLYHFDCTTLAGTPLDWSRVAGKQTLLLFGGLGCMGAETREELETLYKNTSRDDFEIIVYWPVSSLEQLQKINQALPSPYITVSDFLEEGSPMKIKYGAQATPTCFLTNKEGVIVMKSVGLDVQGLTLAQSSGTPAE